MSDALTIAGVKMPRSHRAPSKHRRAFAALAIAPALVVGAFSLSGGPAPVAAIVGGTVPCVGSYNADGTVDVHCDALATPTTPPTVPPTTAPPTVPPTTAPPTTTPPATTPPATTTPPVTTPPGAHSCPAFPATPLGGCTGPTTPVVLLKAYPATGRIVLATAGATYDGYNFGGNVLVRANNVTIRNSLIRGFVDAGDGSAGANQTGFSMVDVEINATGHTVANQTQSSALGFTNWSCTRCNIHGGIAGVTMSGNDRLIDSWVHGMNAATAADHMGAVASTGSSNNLVQHNTLTCEYPQPYDGLCSGAVGIYSQQGTISNWTLTNNLFNAQDGYCVYGGQSGSTQPDHVTYQSNLFGRTYNPHCGYWGSSTSVGGGTNVWADNHWLEADGTIGALVAANEQSAPGK